MTNEARMSIKLMVAPQGDSNDVLGPNRASMKQPSMEDILKKAQKMYQMSAGEQ